MRCGPTASPNACGVPKLCSHLQITAISRLNASFDTPHASCQGDRALVSGGGGAPQHDEAASESAPDNSLLASAWRLRRAARNPFLSSTPSRRDHCGRASSLSAGPSDLWVGFAVPQARSSGRSDPPVDAPSIAACRRLSGGRAPRAAARRANAQAPSR
jgi:hypothetical protein